MDGGFPKVAKNLKDNGSVNVAGKTSHCKFEAIKAALKGVGSGLIEGATEDFILEE
jgi:hypothetical protein